MEIRRAQLPMNVVRIMWIDNMKPTLCRMTGKDWQQANAPLGLSKELGPTKCSKTQSKERSNDNKWSKKFKVESGGSATWGMKVIVQNTMLESHRLFEYHPT
jgi:hypothetical protein